MRHFERISRGFVLPILLVGSSMVPLTGWTATVTPVTQATFFAGQSFLDGTATSVNGNVDVNVTPVVKFSDQWSVFPTYHGFYQGTQDIETLAGGGKLFRDSTGHTLLLKSVHTLGPIKLKPSLGGSMEWLRETKDEDWGQGLYDYRKANGGLEAEYNTRDTFGGRVAYDYYLLDFPNFQSLESAQDPTFSRELAGKDVLNNTNHMGTLSLWTPLPGRGRLDVTGLLNARYYADQPLVNAQGQLTATDRKDNALAMDAVMAYPLPTLWDVRFLGNVGLRYGIQNSNQNHFDVPKNFYQANYYDYNEWRVSPHLSARFNENRWGITLGGYYEKRNYTNRTTQDAGGNYLSEKMNITTGILRWGVAHALSANTTFRVDGSLGWSHSNTSYEDIFQYNYRTANYGIGFTYEY
jgi:hypothetical protein